MVITITMKNVELRSGIYHFRMAVPKDCQKSVGKTEITQSLKTSDPAEAATLSKKLSDQWKQKFKGIRKPAQATAVEAGSKLDDTVGDFKKKLDDHMGERLHDFLIRQTEEELIESSAWLMNCISAVKNNDKGSIDLTEELGITWPLPRQRSPGMARRLNRELTGALARI